MKHETLEAALVAAQAEMPGVQFDATNPFLHNKYASLGAVIRTAQPVLAKHGLGVVQLVKTDETGRVGVETMLVHESGNHLSSVAYLPLGEEKGKSDSQVAGSIISYLRRYSLAAMLGMYADEDVDGNQPKAQPKAVEAKPEPPAQPKMSLESAMAVKSHDGMLYGDIPTDKLAIMHSQILKSLKGDITPEQREQYAFKRDAIAVIIEARNNEGGTK